MTSSRKRGLASSKWHSPGTLIGGRFEVIRELGFGAFAVVWLAQDLSTSEMLAVKTLRPSAPDPKDALRFFLHEIALHSVLDLPNLVQPKAWSFDTTDPYLATTYLEGCTLSTLLQNTANLEMASAFAILAGIAGAVQQLHDVGVAHGDLAPRNVFLISNRHDANSVRIIDLGFADRPRPWTAQILRRISRRGSLAPPRDVIAPEERALSAPTLSGDIYRLGLLTSHLARLTTPPARHLSDLGRKACKLNPLSRPMDAAVFRKMLAAYSPSMDESINSPDHV